MGRARKEFWLAATSLVVALALAVTPLPGPVEAFRPDWAALILLYWVLSSQRRFGLLTAFWMGIALDVLTGSLLGQHALALLIVVYIAQRFYLQIRVFPLSQLTLTVGALLAIYEFVLFWADGIAGRTVPLIERWAPVVAGAALCPLVFLYLDSMRQDRRVRI
jgi:rod shape-determining protein MreD